MSEVIKMGVMWNKAYETTTLGDMPTGTGAVNWSQGFTVSSGTLEFLTLRYNITFAATPVPVGDISNLIGSLRIIINGEVVHDFTAGFANATGLQASQYNYLLNKIGGRVVEESVRGSEQTRQGYINIPIGKVLSSTGQNRIECIVGWQPSDSNSTSGRLEWWTRYNSATETSTFLVPATSFTHANAIEQVIVRCPTNLPAGASIAGVLVLNDTEEDQLGEQGIRCNPLGSYGITVEQWRMINGDLMNGIMYNNGSLGLSRIDEAGNPETFNALQYAQQLNGALLIPTFNLSLGDVNLVVDSSAATTRKYFPIITVPIGGRQKTEQVQTARLAGNTSKAILSNDLQ